MMTERLNVPITLRVDDRAPSTETPEIIEDTNARRESFILPWQIKEMRERLSYSRREMGELFQVGEENWSQWENGADRPDSALSLLMRALYDGERLHFLCIGQEAEAFHDGPTVRRLLLK